MELQKPYTGFVTIRGDQFVMQDEPTRVVRLKGSNFQTVETPWKLFQQWDDAVIDRALSQCQAMGCNCLRTWIDLTNADHRRRWEQLRQKAVSLGMRMYVCFNWSGRFAPSDDPRFRQDRDTLVEVLDTYANDPTVLAYDIINEPEWISHEKFQWQFDPQEGQRRLDWLLRIADVMHERDQRHPVTVGFIFNYTWWTPDWARLLLDRLDFVDFHYYHRTYQARGLDTAIREVKAQTTKPIVVGEFGQSSDPEYSVPYEEAHSEETQRQLYIHAIEAIQSEHIVGGIQWSTCAHNDEVRPAGENEYGIHRQDYSPKPAALVFRDAMKVPLFA